MPAISAGCLHDCEEKLVDTSTYHTLPRLSEHRDPFDRMLFHQCIRMRASLVTRDTRLGCYEPYGLARIWQTRRGAGRVRWDDANAVPVRSASALKSRASPVGASDGGEPETCAPASSASCSIVRVVKRTIAAAPARAPP